MPAPYAIARIEKHASFAAIAQVGAHNLRSSPVPNADPKRQAIQLVPVVGNDLVAAVKSKLPETDRTGKAIRKDAVRMIELVLTASPEYFRPGRAEAAGIWDEKRLQAFRDTVEPWLKERFGDTLVSASLHLDEDTPHYQVCFVPLDDKGYLNAKGAWGGRERLSAFQDEVGELLAPLGIQRGLKGSKAKHTKVAAFYTAATSPLPPLPPIAAKPEPLPPAKGTERILGTDAWKARKAREAKYEEALKAHNDSKAARQRAKVATFDHAAMRANAADLAERKAAEAITTAEAKAREAARAKEISEALKRQAERLRTLPLGDVLEQVYSASLEPGSKPSHSSRKYVLPSGQKFGVSAARNGVGEVWVDQHTTTGSKGAIDLVMHIDGIDAKAAIRLLAEHFDREDVIKEAAERAARREEEAARTAIESAPVPAPEPDETQWPRVREWLATARGLPVRMLDALHRTGVLFADRFANATLRRTGGGALQRGTGPTRFHRVVGSSACGAAVLDGPGHIWVVEGMTDALAVKAHQHDAYVIISGGSMLKPEQLRRALPADCEGRIYNDAFDTDARGRELAKQARKALPALHPTPPPSGKDWSEAVQTTPGLIDPYWLRQDGGGGNTLDNAARARTAFRAPLRPAPGR